MTRRTPKRAIAAPPMDFRTPDEKLTEYFKWEFTSQVERRQHEVDQWIVKFQKDPHYVLSWGKEAFRVTAQLKMLTEIVAVVNLRLTREEDPLTLRQALTALMEDLHDRVLRKAKWPENSNPVSEYADKQLTCVMTENFEKLRDALVRYAPEQTS